MTVRVAATRVANCSTAAMPRQQMFCRRKYSECDRRSLFECQQSAVVWQVIRTTVIHFHESKPTIYNHCFKTRKSHDVTIF